MSEANLIREPGLKAAANVVTLSTTAGDRVDGILYNRPVAGQAAEVVVRGTAKVKAGAAVAAGDVVAVDTNGDFVPSVPGVGNLDKPVGIAKTAAANAAEIFSVILNLQAPVNEAVS